ncbi:MAG TPA: hypothetical protein GXX30_00860 [Firmicutes bacterium]|nr:hypothetical protein [Candidatus Fermentithermobacillaceae bacterium]
MKVLVIPVVNGIIPRESETLTGLLVAGPKRLQTFLKHGDLLLLLPYVSGEGFYPVGAGARVVETWTQDVLVRQTLSVEEGLFVTISGEGTFRVRTLSTDKGLVFTEDPQYLDLKALRKDYPVIDGKGWVPVEGSTEARSSRDIRVEIHGVSHDGRDVMIGANLGGLVTAELAHTVEHAIIRSLSRYALVTYRTLRQSMEEESSDLKASLEMGYRFRMPEFFGVTPQGACGNPLTGLAHFYLTEELVKNLSNGESFERSLLNARLSTLSRVTDDLELSTQKGLRAIQGLKRGMMHDDSVLPAETLKAIIRRFPLSPWG